MVNPIRTLLAVGFIVLGASSPTYGQTTLAPTSQQQTSGAASTGSATVTSLQLLTTVGASPSGANSTGAVSTGSGASSNNGTSTRTGTLSAGTNVTIINTGINPSTAIPSEFPSNGAFLPGRPTAPFLVAAAGFAGLATFCL